MALTHNDTIVDIDASLLPDDYVKPTITTFLDHENKYTERSFTIAKAGVQNADASTTVTAIMTQLNTDIETLINADFDTTVLTVTSYAQLTVLATNNTLDAALYTSTAASYILTVNVFVKTA